MAQKEKNNSNSNSSSRRKEIVDICLEQFVEKGLYDISIRDLAAALGMQPSGLYYHFKSKDEIVVACAEEAELRLEDMLLLPIFDCPDDISHYVKILGESMPQIVPMMQFFTQVCTTKEYKTDIQPVLERLKKRHREYSIKFAGQLGCKPEEVAPYLYACVAIAANHMIFGENFYYTEPLYLIEGAIRELKTQKGGKPESKAEKKPAENKAEAKAESKAGEKPEDKAENKAEEKPESKTKKKPESKAEAKAEGKAEKKPESRAGGKAGGKPESKAEAKPADKAEGKGNQGYGRKTE